MKMIEKVAIAIGGIWGDYCNPCTDEKIVKCKDCLSAAKAAIEVMREPTREMFKSCYGLEKDEVWNAMIDAALKE